MSDFLQVEHLKHSLWKTKGGIDMDSVGYAVLPHLPHLGLDMLNIFFGIKG